MSTVQDLMNAEEFANAQLTEAINIPPYQTGRLAQLGLFVDTPIPTTYAKVSVKDGEFTIIPSRERGGPTNKNMSKRPDTRLIQIPHFPLGDAITPADFQNLLAWGEDRLFETFGGVLNAKLLELRGKHDQTHAHLDWGALNGLILDADGYELLDLYETFGVDGTPRSFSLGTATTDVADLTRDLKSDIRRDLKGAPMTGVRILAGENFFRRYVGHDTVRDAYKYYTSNGNPNRDGLEDGFQHAGAVIERVDEEFAVRLENGQLETRPAIAPNEAVAVPLGTPYFKRYVAPPDTIHDANQAPDPSSKIFVSTEELDHGKGYDIHTESNVLPVCLRPQILKRLSL